MYMCYILLSFLHAIYSSLAFPVGLTCFTLHFANDGGYKARGGVQSSHLMGFVS